MPVISRIWARSALISAGLQPQQGKLEPGRLVSAIGLLIPQCRPGRTTKTPRLQGNLSRRSRSYGHSMGVNTPARKSALAALVFGAYRAYQAAYGAPGKINQIHTQPLTELAERLTDARRHAADDAARQLRQAAACTVAAVVLLVPATGITWFAPTSTYPPTRVCLFLEGRTVAELSANTLTLHGMAAGTTIGPVSYTHLR